MTDVPAAVAALPVWDRDPGPFPFLPALEGFEPVPPASSNWIRSTDFARYGFQSGEDRYVEIGERLTMRHFAASAPGTQSVDKIVESYRQPAEEKGGVVLYTGRFTGGVVDANPRSEQRAREGATYLVRTPERELWAQVEGYTDDRGPAACNQALSERRAAAVRAALLARGLGKDGDARLTSSGHGASAPIADNASEQGRAKNRRVELIER